MKFALSAVIGYLFGSINIAILISKYVLKKDVRQYGSKNAGATNVARVFGPLMGALTLTGDFLKTVLSLAVGRALCGDTGTYIAVIACMIGHCWPLYFGFRGGKGVATGAGVICLFDWRVFLITLAIFIVTVLITKRVSVGSLISSFSSIFLFLLFGHSAVGEYVVISFLILLIWFKHVPNIKRLISGTEEKFSFGHLK